VLQPLIKRLTIGSAGAAEVKPLIAACGLPVEDIGEDSTFVAAREGMNVRGVAGIQRLGAAALLRSVAVDPAWRGKGIAQALCDAAMRRANEHGVRRLFLLTTDAQRFFTKLGFVAVDREALPPEVRETAQFRDLCPQSAIAMERDL
jgi:amino-acid N-acetyltransferase